MTVATAGCTCELPRPSTTPNHLGACRVCGKVIPPELDSANISDIIDGLTAIPEIRVSETFQKMRKQCLAREEVGRERFGYAYLARDNEADALEEIADAINYLCFGLQQRVRAGEDPEEELALTRTALFHGFKFYEAIYQLREKTRGAP